jgi:hypothetical protein
MMPQATVDQYNLTPLIHSNCARAEIRKGTYGLPQAGKLTNKQMIVALASFGYCPVPITTGLWRHDTRNITFCLIVDNCGVQYINKDNADLLIARLQAYNYQLSFD